MTIKPFSPIIILALCLLTTTRTFGQEKVSPQKKALIKEFLVLTNAASTAETIIRQLQQQLQGPTASIFAQGLREQLASEKLTSDERKRAEAHVDDAAQRIVERIRTEIPKRVNYAETIERISTEIYGKLFTEEELKELIAIYKTPVAQKFIKLFPQMSEEATLKIQELILPTITQAITEIVEDEKKKIIAK